MTVPSLPKKLMRVLLQTLAHFGRNLAITFSLPFIDIARVFGQVEIPRPRIPELGPLTENPAGLTVSALSLRMIKKLRGQPLGAAAPILLKLSRIAASHRPVIIGPWLSEVGFEVLYWIPFLQWAVRQYAIDSSRIIILSRGGVDAWYQNVGARYIDILEHFTLQEFRELNARRIEVSGHQKHMELGETDRIILERVCRSAVVYDYEVLHPSMMYQLLLPLWQRRAPAKLAHTYALYLPMSRPDVKHFPTGFPERYTAAKFYFSEAFPRTDANIEKVRAVLRAYLLKEPVVLLSSGVQIDDHTELLDGLPDGLIVYSPDNPARNLLLQTALVANATRFIGTYGGFSYIAPLLNVPSFCFYSDLGRVMPMHLDVAFRVFRQFACGEFEKGSPIGSAGKLPLGRFAALHVDSLKDTPYF